VACAHFKRPREIECLAITVRGIPKEPEGQPVSEYLSIKVTDNNHKVFSKIKRITILKKLTAPSARDKTFDDSRMQPTDTVLGWQIKPNEFHLTSIYTPNNQARPNTTTNLSNTATTNQ